MDGVAIAEEKALVVHHAQVGSEIVKAPKSFRGDFSGGKGKDDGADMALIMFSIHAGLLIGRHACGWMLAGDEAGDAKGEEQRVFVEEIDGDLGDSATEVEGRRRSEAEGGNGDGNVGDKGGLFGSIFFLLLGDGGRLR